MINLTMRNVLETGCPHCHCKYYNEDADNKLNCIRGQSTILIDSFDSAFDVLNKDHIVTCDKFEEDLFIVPYVDDFYDETICEFCGREKVWKTLEESFYGQYCNPRVLMCPNRCEER